MSVIASMRLVKSNWTKCMIVTGALLFFPFFALGLGADYPAGRPVLAVTNWPKGLETLVNSTNRVHGYFVNQEDLFFFSGSVSELTQFLRDCSDLPDVVSRRFILHAGVGEAKSPWEKTGRPCDWELYVCSKGWHNLHAASARATNSIEVLRQLAHEPGYILEVHFWTGGHIRLDEVEVPKKFETKKE